MPGPRDRIISTSRAQRLGPNGGQVQETVSIATDAAVVLNSLLGGLNQVPLTSVNALDTDQLKQIQESLSDFTGSAQKLGVLLQQSAPEGESVGLEETTARMEELLDRIITWTAEFRTRVGTIQSQVADLKSRILNWIRVGPVVITVALIWVSISQLSLFAVARSWFKRPGKLSGIEGK